MARPVRFLFGFFCSLWLHGGLFGLLLMAAPWLALLDPSLAPPPEAEGPISVTAEFPQDGDLTASEDANPDPTVGGVTTVDPAATPSTETLTADKTAPKPKDAAKPESGYPASWPQNKGADQPQAKGTPKKNKTPCPDPVPEIVFVETNKWVVEREFVDYYASHLSEAMKLAGTWPHKDKDGKPDGFRVGLPRCSVLRQGGLKSGDVIRDINGIRINNMLGAIAAWFDLRNDPHVTVNLVRGGKQVSLKYKIQPRKRK